MWSSSHTQPLPIGSPPFHLPSLNNLHAHILSTAPEPASALDYLVWLVLPHAFGFPQAYLLTAPRADKSWNRTARFLLGALGIAAVVNSLLSYRLHDPRLQILNYLKSYADIYVAFFYAEGALLKHTVVDPYTQRRAYDRPRSHLNAAINYLLEKRFIGFGSIGVDETSGRPNTGRAPKVVWSAGMRSPRSRRGRGRGGRRSSLPPSVSSIEAVLANGQITPPRTPVESEIEVPRHLTHLLRVPIIRRHARYRNTALLRHGVLAAGHFASLGLVVGLARQYDGPVLSWTDLAGILTGATPSAALAATLLVSLGLLVAQISALPAAAYFLISGFYHLAALATIGTGRLETESWDIDLFGKPWAPTSVLDFWGRQWHQVLRHQLVSIASLVLGLFGPLLAPYPDASDEHPPTASLALVLTTFIVSGAQHGLASISSSPPPEPSKLFASLALSGVAAAAEIHFKRKTGRTVGGVLGRVWAAAVLLSAGKLMVDAYLAAGWADQRVWEVAYPVGGTADVVARTVLDVLGAAAGRFTTVA
ncbi:hypothetical protein Q8F55_003361 [Vanrija albida]|uniref:Wax synthase domain-containing protein n=1 Tax=Vanrija albida TaxID=181172 RepID=A0ABR3Q3Z1_9TREE